VGTSSAGANFGQPRYETDLLYLARLAALVLGDSGSFALDAILLRYVDLPTQQGSQRRSPCQS